MKKRIFSVLLCLCLVLAMLPTTALATDSYTVTYNANGGTGTVPTQADTAAGATFALSVSPELTYSGKTFIGWTDGTNSYLPGATYTMPANNVTLTALWTDSNPHPETEVKIANQPLSSTNAYYHNGTSENLSGTANSDAAGASAYFKGGVLVLNGLNVNNGKIEWEGTTSDTNDDLVIVLLSGSVNTVTNTSGSAIVGTGNLFTYGPCLTIRTSGNTPATLYAIGDTNGLWVWQDTTIEGSAKVIAQGRQYVGIATNTTDGSGVFTVKDSADVKAVGGRYGIAGDVTHTGRVFASIAINGGKLLAQGGTQALEKAATTTITPTSGTYSDQVYWVGTTGATRATKPTTTFAATDSTSGVLSGVTEQMQYKLGYSDWVQITGEMISDGKITLNGLPASGATISVQNTNGTTGIDDDSDVQVMIADMTVSSYNVTYDANGATSGSAPAGASVTSGTSYTVAGNTGSLEKTGYTFSGWNTAANGSGTDYAAGVTITVTDNITLYAKWTANNYSIDLDTSGTHTFTAATEGYAEQTALTVTVTNTGNQPTGELTVALSGTDASSFTLSTTTINSIAVSGTPATFTVQPKTGLSADTYTATVTVSNTEHSISASFHVSFTVNSSVVVVPTYSVTVADSTHGTVTANRAYAYGGNTITLTVTPDEGFALDTLTVTTAAGKEIAVTDNADGTYTFKMPYSKVTVKAAFAEIVKPVTNPFPDVEEGDYFYDAALWAFENGITTGTGDGTAFRPDASCTRAQAVTFLWRAAGSPAPKSSAMPFGDVAADAYYHDAVLWAVEQGITKGTSDTAFSPDVTCTRAQIVTFLWRAAVCPASSDRSGFADVSADAYYANAVAWAVEQGITNGTSDTAFSPDATCTRAQIVTFLYRDISE